MNTAYSLQATGSWRLYTTIFLVVCATIPLVLAEMNDDLRDKVLLKEALTLLQMKNLLDLYVESPEHHESLNVSCHEQLLRYAEGISRGEYWALKMLDASSRIPVGVLEEHLHDMGMYDECMSVRVKDDKLNKHWGGRHCTYFVKFRNSHELDMSSLALCLPDTCDSSAVTVLLDNAIQRLPIVRASGIQHRFEFCSKNYPKIYPMQFYVVIGVLGSILCVEAMITAFDVVDRHLKRPASLNWARGLLVFSMYRNMEKVFRTTGPAKGFPALDGLRVITMFMVMALHILLSPIITPDTNISTLLKLHSTWTAPLLLIPLLYAVETFFVISGFLTSFNFITDVSHEKHINIPLFYLRRYLRLTPLALVTVVIMITLPHIGAGPRWDFNMDLVVNSCYECFWSLPLYIQNITFPYNLCAAHLWYLSVDMQLHVLSPVLLYAFVKKPKFGYILLGSSIILAMIFHGYVISSKKIPTLFGYNISVNDAHIAFAYDYKMPYTRFGSYGFGLLFGYLVATKRNRICRVHLWLGSLSAIACILFVILLCTNFSRTDYKYGGPWEVIYNCLSHPAWGFAAAWIIYVTACEEKGELLAQGLLGRFLSLPIFLPLSRISYAFYMTHLLIPFLQISYQRVPDYWNIYHALLKISMYTLPSLFIAFLVTIAVEIPLLTLLRARRYDISTNGKKVI